MHVRNRFFIIIIPLLISSLACQAAFSAFSPAPVDSPTPELRLIQSSTPTSLPPTATLTPQPSQTATPTATATLPPTPSPVQLRVFEELWQTIQEDYLYPDFNGLNWNGVHEEYEQRVKAGLNEEGFYSAMEEMVSRLDDEHSFFLSPEEADSEDNEYSGDNDFVGIGILSIAIPERQRISIILVFPDSPAERAGLVAHDSILAVDGHSIFDEEGYRRDLLRGSEGTQVELTVQTPNEEPRTVTLIRSRVTGPMPVPWDNLLTSMDKNIGYLMLPSFADETIDDQVAEALADMSTEKPLDGLIIDNRQNSGGADNIARGVLSYFTRGRLGHFVDRHNTRRSLSVIGTDIAGSSTIPLVVLIGPDTISFGEIFAGILHDSGRAYLIGDATNGNMELLWGYDLEDGSRAWIAREAFYPLNHPEQEWEETGIIPDLTLATSWDEVTLHSDPAVQASLEYFDKLP